MDRICANRNCRVHFPAKAADVKRGWGRFCSKSCKATQQAVVTGVHDRLSNYLINGRSDEDKYDDPGDMCEHGQPGDNPRE